MLQGKLKLSDLTAETKKDKRRIEYDEEQLFQVLDCELVDGCEKILTGIDAGSTQTRVSIIGEKENQDIYSRYTIPSSMNILNSGIEITPISDYIYDNMDSWITNTNKAPNNIFDKVRVLRGKKLEDSNLGETRMDSLKKKIEQPSFYINIIESIAYGIMQRAIKHGLDIYKKYDVYACVSLPPQDMLASSNRAKFVNTLTGKFIFSNDDLGIDSLEINIIGVKQITEPESEVKTMSIIENISARTIALLEGGGKNIGFEILQDMESIKSLSKTIPFGGTQFISAVCVRYAAETGRDEPSETMMLDAIKTGYLVDGGERIDIRELIKRVKTDFAKDIFAHFLKIIQVQQKVLPTAIEVFCLSGGLWRAGDYGFSMASVIQEEFKKYSANTKFIVCKDNYIPLGNLIVANEYFGGYVFEDAEEQSEEQVDNTDVAVDSAVEEKEIVEEIVDNVVEEVIEDVTEPVQEDTVQSVENSTEPKEILEEEIDDIFDSLDIQ